MKQPTKWLGGLSAVGVSSRVKKTLAGGGCNQAVDLTGPSKSGISHPPANIAKGVSLWRNGGRGVKLHWAVTPTTLGSMLVAATDKGVCRLSFDEGHASLLKLFPEAELIESDPTFSDLLKEVIDAVEHPGKPHSIPLDTHGTAFQQAVWAELRRIPAGETRSYAQIAAAVGKPAAVRATGSANGANNIAVLIPCHRVVRADGSLGGYEYGPEMKKELLRRENAMEPIKEM